MKRGKKNRWKVRRKKKRKEEKEEEEEEEIEGMK